MGDPAIVAAANAAPVLLLSALAIAARASTREPLPSLIAAALPAAASAGVIAASVTGDVDLARRLGVAGAAAAGAVIVTAVLRTRARFVAAALLGGIIAGGALALIAALQLAVVPSLLERALAAVDLGGALARYAAPAAMIVGFLLAGPGVRAGGVVGERSRTVRWSLAGAAAVIASLAVAAGALAGERSVDAAPGILLAVAAGAALGVTGWMLVVRIAGRAAHPVDPVAGALVGAAAVVLVLPALVPVAVAAAAAAAGLAGGAVRGARRPGLGACLGVLTGIAAGGVIVGLLADGIGFAATGGLAQSAAQVLAVIAVAAVGGASGALMGVLLRLVPERNRQRVTESEAPGNDNSPGEPRL